MKISVISLGEEPMKSKTENKGEKFKEIIELAKVLRSVFPSFVGLMLQTNSVYITSEEFKQYEDITKHERLGKGSIKKYFFGAIYKGAIFYASYSKHRILSIIF